MIGTTQPRDARLARWLPAAAFVLPVAARALSFTSRILDRDETYWMASALRMRAADLPPYVAGWDTKPPAAFLFHRLALALAPESPLLAAHVLSAVLAGLAAVLVADAARRLHGVAAGAVAAVLFALLDSTGPVRAMAANTELLTYVPVAAIVACVAAGRPRGLALPFAVGALAALAFLAKHPAALYAPAGYAAILLARRDGRPWLASAGAGLAGTAVVLGAAFGWLALAGAWSDFVACNVTISLNRAASGSTLATEYGWGRWIGVARANPLVLVGAAAAAIAAVRATGPARVAAAVAGPLAVAGLLAALAGGAAFQHYLQMAYPPLAVLAAVGLACAAAPLARRAGPVVAAGAVVAAAAACALPDRVGQWRSRNWAGYDGGPVAEVRDRVRALTAPDDTIFVWGIHPDLYVLCDRAPATRFISAGWLVGSYTGRPATPDAEPFEFVPGSWDLLFRDLDASRPRVVVDSVPAGVHGFGAYPVERFPRLTAWLEAGYERQPAAGGYVLWVRRP